MDVFFDYVKTMDSVTIGLVTLPIVAVILCGFYLMDTTRNDTMQRSGSKVNHTTKTQKELPHHSQMNMKCDSSDSGISTNGNLHHQLHQHQQQHQHHHHNQQQNALKQRKSRSFTKTPICGNNNGPKQRLQANAAATIKTTSTATKVGVWLDGRNMMYCYERRFLSSCAEDNLLPRHNPEHRNSTSSDAAVSDDLNSSSSNEDLSTGFHVVPKTGKKKPNKTRQRRRQKCKQQTATKGSAASEEAFMEIDEEAKENQEARCGGNSRPQEYGKMASTNLRKQCTKAAAVKAANNSNNSSSNNTRNNNNNGSNNNKGTKNNNSNNSANNNNSNNNNSSSKKNKYTCSGSSESSFSQSSSSSSSSSLSSLSGKLGCSSSASNSQSNSANCSPNSSPTVTKRSTADHYKKFARAFHPPDKHFVKQWYTESELLQKLRRYLLDPNLLRVYGYPVESAVHEGCIEIYKCLPKTFTHHTHSTTSSSYQSEVINTSDGLCLNELWTAASDSGQCSVDSTPPSMDSDSSEVGEDDATGTTAFYTPDGSYQIFSHYDRSLKKQCVRCKRPFHVTDSGEYLSQEQCVFHWGKLIKMYTASKGFGYQYSCCEGDEDSEGCSRNYLHVWTGAVVGINGPYTDYVHTRPRAHSEESSSKVYALDCEMSFTGRGLEVTKITVVGYDGQIVYEHFVRPDAEVVDYNTRFSGVTKTDLAHSNNAVKTLAQVQQDLLQLISADTVLIGHALDNDLRALRIVHKTVIDTSIAFPHNSGFPYRRSLKHLTKLCLNRDIQCGSAGHSSYEDSRACLELMLYKVRKDSLRTESELEQELNSKYICL